MENMRIWDKVKTPPKGALKRINGGRLNGMTDISPQWRLQVITETFGPVGFGWTYQIKDRWIEDGAEGIRCCFAHVAVKYKEDGEWSEWFEGIGGSMLVAKEKAGLHTSDECYKMAVTDGLSVAFKASGVAAEVYLGNLNHDSKYQTEVPQTPLDKLDPATYMAGKLKGLQNAEKAVAEDFLELLTVETEMISRLPADRKRKFVALVNEEAKKREVK